MTRLSGCLMFRLPPLSLLFQMLAFAPAPLQKQSESLGHLCQKCAFAPTLFKCKMNHLVIFVKSMPLPPPRSNAGRAVSTSVTPQVTSSAEAVIRVPPQGTDTEIKQRGLERGHGLGVGGC